MSRTHFRLLDEVRPKSVREDPGFTFDDAILKPSGAQAAAPVPLHLDEPEERQGTPWGAARPVRGRRLPRRPPQDAIPGVAPGVTPGVTPGVAPRDAPVVSAAEPRACDSVSSRGLPVALACLGAALLLIGVLFLGLLRENLGPDPLAQWRSAPPPLPTAAPAPSAEPIDPRATDGIAAARGVRVIKVPAVPGPLASRPAPPPEAPPEAPPQAPGALPAAPALAQQPELPAGRTVPAPADGDEETLYVLADEYRQLGDTERAEQLLRRLFREGRQPGRAALGLGDLYLARERFAEAREMFELSRELYGEEKRTRGARQ